MRHNILCGKCGRPHGSVAAVRACHDGHEIYPCTWLVPIVTEDGPGARDCGADAWAWADDRGYGCVAGHSHVYCEVRAAEGWDYAEDGPEAQRLARLGVTPMSIDGTRPARY